MLSHGSRNTMTAQPSSDLALVEAALFTQRPVIRSTDCTDEIMYAGYRRVPAVIDRHSNLTDIIFQKSEQAESVIARYLVLIDGRGVIVAYQKLTNEINLKPHLIGDQPVARDVYKLRAVVMFNVLYDAVTEEQRKAAKVAVYRELYSHNVRWLKGSSS